jgi:hypothetical protein
MAKEDVGFRIRPPLGSTTATKIVFHRGDLRGAKKKATMNPRDLVFIVFGIGFVVGGALAIIFRKQLLETISANQRARFGSRMADSTSAMNPNWLIPVGAIGILVGAVFLSRFI